MNGDKIRGFRCYICGKIYADQTERARPCGYDRFNQPVCKSCCEACHAKGPSPCPQYNTRKRREKKEARMV